MPAITTGDEKRERQTRPEPALAPASASDKGGAAHGTGESAEAASRISLMFPVWQTSIEATANLFAAALNDGLKLIASSLHVQATYLKNVADSKTPSDLLRCHLDLAEQSWSKSFSQGSKMLDHFRTHPLSAVR
ncbi:hypothetical protein [Bradyrhizobium paxllaeri]|uniref:hypothetical protein n=1 Tax=Bradyrhizobium paxllaeri TaxID=190148 RepID=UPI0009FD4955|nr:hypothetical protein [Bradyrhizobium paxllaeri]